MTDDIAAEIEALQHMTTKELAERYAELHGQPSKAHHRAYLIRKIAWRLQARAEGDLTERARRRAEELADDADVRVMAPRTIICPPQPTVTETHYDHDGTDGWRVTTSRTCPSRLFGGDARARAGGYCHWGRRSAWRARSSMMA